MQSETHIPLLHSRCWKERRMHQSHSKSVIHLSRSPYLCQCRFWNDIAKTAPPPSCDEQAHCIWSKILCHAFSVNECRAFPAIAVLLPVLFLHWNGLDKVFFQFCHTDGTILQQQCAHCIFTFFFWNIYCREAEQTLQLVPFLRCR